MTKTLRLFFIFAGLLAIAFGLWKYRSATPILPFEPIRKMAFIPAGTFLMGSTNSPAEMPVRKISLNAFWIDKFEVTNKDFEKFKPEHKKFRKLASINDDQPVVHVTWREAQAYCDWRCDREGVPRGTYRLPTEAEWEYAARGGLTQKKFPWGDLPPNAFDFLLANYKCENNTNYFCKKVGSFPPNGFGLFDMAGNVREWCFDLLADYPKEKFADNPTGPTTGIKKVWRGGSWGSEVNDLRCAARGGISPTHWLDNLGFRCVRIK